MPRYYFHLEGGAQQDEKLRPVSVAEEVERLLDHLVGFAACRCE